MLYDVVKNLHQASSASFYQLCKAEGDIPEVEASIALVLGRLGPFWTAKTSDGIREILGKLRRLEDRLPTASVDFLANDGDGVLFVEALIGALRRRLHAPMPPRQQEALRGLTETLLRAGGDDRIDRALPSAAALLEAAEADLMLLVRGRLETRLAEVEEHLSDYLTSRRVRGDKSAWTRDLEHILGMDVTHWLPATVDAWAYRWFNIAHVVSLHQGGARTLVLWNPRDEHTTPFCHWVHGREVPIALAMEHIGRYQQAAIAGDIGKTEKLWPLKTYDGHGSKASFFARHTIPPFHFKCRTKVRVKKGEDVR